MGHQQRLVELSTPSWIRDVYISHKFGLSVVPIVWEAANTHCLLASHKVQQNSLVHDPSACQEELQEPSLQFGMIEAHSHKS